MIKQRNRMLNQRILSKIMVSVLIMCSLNDVALGHEEFTDSRISIADTEPKLELSVRNLYTCQTDKYFIKIDLLQNDELRYTCWNKPKNMEDEPDLILVGGDGERQGTQGGIIYSFDSGPWTYELDHVKVCPHYGGCGLFLTVYNNGNQVVRYEAEETEPQPE